MDKDLKLLLLLIVLHEERNTERAAERLFVTQSAISKGLKKLREQMNDILFIRAKEGFIPTDTCTNLVSKVLPLLAGLEDIYINNNQTPTKEYTGEISISISPALYYAIAEDIYLCTKNDFPYATIRLVNWSDSTEQQLVNATTHIGINYQPIDITKDLVEQMSSPVNFRFITNKNHPLANKCVTFEDISKFPLVLNVIPNFTNKKSKIEYSLHKLKLHSNIILRSDNADLCIATLKKIDAIMPVNNLFFEKASLEYDFISLNTVFNIDDYISPIKIGLYYSENFSTEPLGEMLIASLTNKLDSYKI